MKTQTKILVSLPVLLFLFTPIVKADDAFPVWYDVKPATGTVDTKILIMLRADPIVSTEPLWVYVFWDDIVILQRILAPYNAKTGKYTRLWDITITPPREYPYCKKDRHTIRIMLEDDIGNHVYKTWSFKITEFIPPANWWDDMPKSFFDKIIGEQGPQGL